MPVYYAINETLARQANTMNSCLLYTSDAADEQ